MSNTPVGTSQSGNSTMQSAGGALSRNLVFFKLRQASEYLHLHYAELNSKDNIELYF